MIPNTVWIEGKSPSAFTHYGKAKPIYSSNNPYFVTQGPSEISYSNSKLNTDWWLFEEVEGTVKIYKFVNGYPKFELDLFVSGSVTKLSATFDQNGRPLTFFDTGIELKLYWYNPVLADYALSSFGVGNFPFATFDMRYYVSSEFSDVLLFYIRNGGIYYRVQRNQFDVEYATPATDYAIEIIEADITVDYRMQIYYISDDPDIVPPPPVPPDPSLPPAGAYWAYRLSGMQSYITTQRGIIDPINDAFSVTLDIDSVDLTAGYEVAIFSQNGTVNTGIYGAGLLASFTGDNFDVFRLIMGGVLNEYRLPFALQPGNWVFNFYRDDNHARKLVVKLKRPNDNEHQVSPVMTYAVGPNQETARPFVYGAAYTVRTYGLFFKGVMRNMHLVAPKYPKDLVIKVNNKDDGMYPKAYDNEGNPVDYAYPIIRDYRSQNWFFNR